ncbi:trans-aconitate methyltransferase [Legionella gratiana]|uniref:Trans-aconitate methyltransferase n=1 Tax=Legionella gratiana TaxID=45066 RepID=A0A378J9N0_9GAMM|nr:methyltransferase domain-containing protein [Legionella gratiana]KTD14788.1 trans-aconitate methyltransferase [Legionella gratiana]STX44179.1 trans-aconitate methyltransferase [Legionella gratiana]
MNDIWNAKIYSQFLELRTRPACDLLNAIPTSFQPKIVYDLGCGPGNSSILLKQRWPSAKIVGLDSSADMLNQARSTYTDITFIQDDIAHFSPSEKIDCIFANASLQWLPDHNFLFPKLLELLNSGGILAVQMPNNFHLPTHQIIIKLLQMHHEWRPFLKQLIHNELSKPLYHLPSYYDLLSTSSSDPLHLWETIYYQEMENFQAIFDWIKGTGLRPLFTRMSENDARLFSKEYIQEISKEYYLQKNNKVLLPFQRIFMIGAKKR